MSETALQIYIARLAIKLGVQTVPIESNHGWVSVFENCLGEIECLLEIESRYAEERYARAYAEGESNATPESLLYGGSYINPVLEGS
jgi:hypothetical protein